MNYGFKLPEIVRFAEVSGVDYDSYRLGRSKKMQIILSSEGFAAAEEYAQEMRKFNVYDLPFDECYFEVVFSDARIGYLCWKERGKILARAYRWHADRIDIERYVIAVASSPDGEASAIHAPSLVEGGIPASVDLLKLAIERRGLESQIRQLNEEMVPHDQAHIDAAIGSLSLLGAHNSLGSVRRTSSLRKKIAPEFFTHSVISVPLDRGEIGARRKSCETRSPVRLHWRRGHIRRLANGSLIKVRPALIGDRRFGAISSEYVVQSKAA